MVILHSRLALVFLAAVACVYGCDDKPKADLQAAQAPNPHHEAILAYSSAVERVEPLRLAFVSQWERAMQRDDVQGLIDAVKTSVEPALDALVEAIAAMPAPTEELQGIHGVMQRAFEEFRGAVRTFAGALREDSRREPIEALIEQIGALTAQERIYREQLETYYRKHGATVKAAPSPPAAPEPNPQSPSASPTP